MMEGGALKHTLLTYGASHPKVLFSNAFLLSIYSGLTALGIFEFHNKKNEG